MQLSWNCKVEERETRAKRTVLQEKLEGAENKRFI
jgi:hypothetical protein